MSNQKQVVSWRSLPGNKFNRALHPAMLSPSGYEKSMPLASPVGQQMKSVIYNRDYVVHYLALKVFKALEGVSWSTIIHLLESAHDLAHEEYGLQPPLFLRQHNEWEQP